MLPEIVAGKLKNGLSTTETFKSTTAGFIKIDDYTNLARLHSPIEAIHMLNRIYTTLFNTRLQLYNVYKVETITDIYQVASGVPDRNKTHSPEVAGFCLDISQTCKSRKIQNDLSIGISAGLYSGLVVAWCGRKQDAEILHLWGNVNTASRQRRNGENLNHFCNTYTLVES